MTNDSVTSRLLDGFWQAYFRREYGVDPSPVLRQLALSQYWSRNDLERYQRLHLNRLIMLAQGTAWYRQKLRSSPVPLETPAQLVHLPCLTKTDIRQHATELRSNNVMSDRERVFRHSTSGSSGDPLEVLVNATAEAYRFLGRCRYYDWWGIRAYDSNILVWSSAALPTPPPDWKKSAKAWLRKHTVERTCFINVFELATDKIAAIFDRALSQRPVYMRGYLSGIVQFGELLIDNSIDPKRLGLKLVVVTSETLYPEQRSFLESSFGCPVANEYGGAEAGLIAFDCPQQRLHIYEEAVFLSTLTDGRGVTTELYNTAMPLINYVNDDVLVLDETPCPCGRTLRTIAEVQGRVSDFALKSSGEKVSAYLFYYAVKELADIGLPNAVRKYKVVQQGQKITFSIVKDSGYTDAVLPYLEQRIKNTLGTDIDVNFRLVPQIEREKSGKLRFFTREA